MNAGAFGGLDGIMQSLGQAPQGGLSSLGMQQAALSNLYQTYTTATTPETFTFVAYPAGVAASAPLSSGASPADPPEVLWLKGQIKKVCWRP